MNTNWLRPAPWLEHSIAERIQHFVQWCDEFFKTRARVPVVQIAPQTRAEKIAQFMHSNPCTCRHGTCSRCMHLIRDVVGDA